MRLTKQQREVMDAWMSENMMTGDHCIVWATEELAPLLGLGDDISSNWDVLHPLAFEVRKWCKEHKAKPPKRMEPPVEFGWERRKAECWVVNPAREVECVRCGARFQTNRRNAKRCPDCIAKGLDAHPRRGADAYATGRGGARRAARSSTPSPTTTSTARPRARPRRTRSTSASGGGGSTAWTRIPSAYDGDLAQTLTRTRETPRTRRGQSPRRVKDEFLEVQT